MSVFELTLEVSWRLFVVIFHPFFFLFGSRAEAKYAARILFCFSHWALRKEAFYIGNTNVFSRWPFSHRFFGECFLMCFLVILGAFISIVFVKIMYDFDSLFRCFLDSKIITFFITFGFLFCAPPAHFFSQIGPLEALGCSRGRGTLHGTLSGLSVGYFRTTLLSLG